VQHGQVVDEEEVAAPRRQRDGVRGRGEVHGVEGEGLRRRQGRQGGGAGRGGGAGQVAAGEDEGRAAGVVVEEGAGVVGRGAAEAGMDGGLVFACVVCSLGQTRRWRNEAFMGKRRGGLRVVNPVWLGEGIDDVRPGGSEVVVNFVRGGEEGLAAFGCGRDEEH
jgi:hypothetical protein